MGGCLAVSLPRGSVVWWCRGCVLRVAACAGCMGVTSAGVTEAEEHTQKINEQDSGVATGRG